jgi:photosystem II stability/assembly factor-like uncharacterized protein
MKRRAALSFALLFCCGALVLAGCGDDNGTEPQPDVWYGDIAISKSADTLRVGESLVFSVAVTDTAGQPVISPRLTWSSSDPAVASVDGNGRVTAQIEGATIILASGGHVASNPETLVVVQGLGWVDQSSAALTTNTLNGVHFFDRQRGWAVGNLGTILATVDGGLSWVRQTSQSTGYILDGVFFTSSQHGFVVGSSGRILETGNGGAGWTPRVGIDTDGRELHDVFFLGEDLGFIVGNGGVLLRTEDGGATWTRIPSGVTAYALYSVWATAVPGPDTLAWAVGDNGTIIGSRDAGRTWSIPTPSITAQNLRSVVRLSNTQALAVGFQNTVGATAASGDTAVWALAPPPTDYTVFWDLAWPSPTRAYAVGFNSGGRANVLLSSDGGQSWTTQNLPGTAPIAGNSVRSVWFVDDTHGWAVGELGLVLHTATGGEP